MDKRNQYNVKIDVREHKFQQIYIEITNKCNLECNYCFNSSSKEGKFYMDKTMIFSLVKSCRFRKKRPLVYLSGGEPLLHRDIVEIIHVLIEELECDVKILSNGVLVNSVMVGKLNSKTMWQIGSALIATPDMAKRNWKRFRHCISMLLEQFPQNSITLSFTITNKNIQLLETYVNEFKDMERVNILLSFVQERGKGKQCWSDIMVPFSVKLKLIKKYSNKIRNVKFCGINLDEDIYKILNFELENLPNLSCENVIEYYVDYKKNIHFCNKIDVFCKCKGIEGSHWNNRILNISEKCNVGCEIYQKCMMSCIPCMGEDGCICKII